MSLAPPAIFTEWPEGLSAMLAVDTTCRHAGVPDRLLELVRLWCSVLNDCQFCIAMHRQKAATLGIAAAAIEALVGRRDTSGLDDHERVLLGFASALTMLRDGAAIRAAKAPLREAFDRQQIVVLSYAIAQINAWNRLACVDA